MLTDDRMRKLYAALMRIAAEVIARDLVVILLSLPMYSTLMKIIESCSQA
jgi:hypothetical protein